MLHCTIYHNGRQYSATYVLERTSYDNSNKQYQNFSVFPKAKAQASKDKKTIVIKDMMVQVDNDAIDRLIDGVKQGLSIRSTLAAIVADDSPKEYDLIKASDSAVAKAMKHNVTEASLIAAIKASYEKARKAEASK